MRMFQVKGLWSPIQKPINIGPAKHMAILPEDIVLDLGAHIGTFSRFARAKGATVISVEPDPTTFSFLCLNCQDCTRLNAAIVGDTDGRQVVPFYRDISVSGTSATMLRKRTNGPCVDVPAITLATLVAQYKPTVIKIDIEGQEYALDLVQHTTNVRTLAVSFHKAGYPAWHTAIPKIHDSLIAAGFQAKIAPKLDGHWMSFGEALYER